LIVDEGKTTTEPRSVRCAILLLFVFLSDMTRRLGLRRVSKHHLQSSNNNVSGRGAAQAQQQQTEEKFMRLRSNASYRLA
jgi:hypothetical protein